MSLLLNTRYVSTNTQRTFEFCLNSEKFLLRWRKKKHNASRLLKGALLPFGTDSKHLIVYKDNEEFMSVGLILLESTKGDMIFEVTYLKVLTPKARFIVRSADLKTIAQTISSTRYEQNAAKNQNHGNKAVQSH